MTPNGSATNSSTYYYNFHIGLTGVQNVLAVWSTPQQVVNYTYDGSTYYLDGLCSFDSYTLQEARRRAYMHWYATTTSCASIPTAPRPKRC